MSRPLQEQSARHFCLRLTLDVRRHRSRSMNSTVSLSVHYIERDYVQALQAHYASHLRLRIDIVVLVAIVAIGGYLWLSDSSRLLGVVLLSIAAMFSLMLAAAFTVIPRLIFRREPKFRDEYVLAFSPEGVHFRTAHIDSRLEWRIYSRVLVGANSYVLYYGSRQFTVIPKRVFQSFEQQQAFEHLLTQHIPEILKGPK